MADSQIDPEMKAWVTNILGGSTSELIEKSIKILHDGGGTMALLRALPSATTPEDLTKMGIPIFHAIIIVNKLQGLVDQPVSSERVTKVLDDYFSQCAKVDEQGSPKQPPKESQNLCHVCKKLMNVASDSNIHSTLKHSFDKTHWHCLPPSLILEREDAKATLEKALAANIQNLHSTEKQHHVVCTAFGFVGIGKTTLGQDIAHHLQVNGQPVAYIFVDFSNGEKILTQEPLTYAEFKRELSLRILARMFHHMSYTSATEKYPNELKNLKHKAPNLSLKQLLQHYTKQHECAVVLHFDEINYLKDDSQRNHLIQYLWEAMDGSAYGATETPVPLLPLLTGTTQSTSKLITLSKIQQLAVPLKPLTTPSQNAIVLSQIDAHLSQLLPCNANFQLLVGSTLGVPRLILQLRCSLIQQIRLTSDLSQDLDSFIMDVGRLFELNVSGTYSIANWKQIFHSDTLALQFMCFCIRGKLMDVKNADNIAINASLPGIASPFASLPGNPTFSWQYLIDSGFIHTSTEKTILMPYVLASNLLMAHAGLSHLKIFFVGYPLDHVSWKQLENLEPYFLKFLVACFNSVEKDMVLSFCDIWRGGAASEQAKNLKIKMPDTTHFQVIMEHKQWIDTNRKEFQIKFPLLYTDSDHFVNLSDAIGSFTAAPHNPLFDVRTVFDLADVDQASEHELLTEWKSDTKKRVAVSSATPNKNQKKETRKLLNLVQMKSSVDANKKLKASDIYTWYKEATQLNYDPFVVLFTYYTTKDMEYDLAPNNEPWTQDRLLEECPNLVIMSRDRLDQYLSPTFSILCNPNSSIL